MTNILWDENSTIHDKFVGLLDDVKVETFEIVYIRSPGAGGIPPAESNKRNMDEQDSERENKRQRHII